MFINDTKQLIYIHLIDINETFKQIWNQAVFVANNFMIIITFVLFFLRYLIYDKSSKKLTRLIRLNVIRLVGINDGMCIT